MTSKTFGLVAACMLAGTFNASAQNKPDKQEAPGKAEMPASESGKPSAKEAGGERAHGKSESRENNKAAQSEQKNKGSDKSESKRDKGSSAQNEEPKAERNKSADKAPRDEKPESKAAQSKSESKANDKSAADSKSDSPSSKSAERDKSKSDDKGDSASGTSSGESGTSAPGKLTDDKKKNDEVKRVQVSGEKRDRVQAGFKSHGDVKHVTDVNVNISVGSRASRDWAFVPVPVAVIEVVPEYRGYVFAYVGDDYVVCDPDTYEIVAVLPASGSGGGYASSSSSSAAKCSTDLTLSNEDRRDIIQSIEMTNEVSVSGVSVGWAVPQDIEVRALPPRVVERTSQLGACRYFIVDDQIAIVDPDEDKVVLMIEHD
jgi:hypothetical protein